MDEAMGRAVLFRSIGLLIFAQARPETNQWAVCQIPVAVDGGYQWRSLQPWRVQADAENEQLQVEPSVADLSDKFQPNWHNTFHWQVNYIEGDLIPAYELEDVGYADYCRRINEQAFAGWQFLE